MKEYEVIVIGTGGGNKLASSLMKLGKNIALIEKGKAGGTCLNRGCIPSKMLIYPTNRYHDLQSIGRLNIQAEESNINFPELIQRINKHTDSASEGIDQARDESTHVDYYKGAAKFESNNVVSVNDQQLRAEKIVIATGSRPFIPEIPGLAHTPFMTSNEALRAKKLPKNMLVLGGGYIATELGGAYASAGSDVTFLLRSEFLRNVDSEIKAVFVEEFSKNKNVVHYSDLLETSYQSGVFAVEVETNGRREKFEAEELLVAAGVLPNSDQLGLENTDIKMNQRGFIETNDFLETSVPGVYAIGDVAGNYLFRHSVNFEAEYWVDSNCISASPFPIDYPPVPSAVFTDPEIASVGLTEEEAQSMSIDYQIGKANYSSCAMNKARGLEVGMVKLIFDKANNQIIGAHIIGEEAATMIQELVLAVTHQHTAEDLYRQIYIHPAFPEVVRNAVRDALKKLVPKYQILV